MEDKILNTPIVATKAAAKEQIQDGINGILCDTAADSIAQAVEKALTDKELLKKIIDAVSKEDFYERNEEILNNLYNLF